MKIFAAILVIAASTFGMAHHFSSAENNIDAWDNIEGNVSKLVYEQQLSEYEISKISEIIILGSKKETEEAIRTLTSFLKSNRNTALREVSREIYTQLIKQRKEGAEYRARNAGQKRTCTMEIKICPNGSLVDRIGPNCEFAACQP